MAAIESLPNNTFNSRSSVEECYPIPKSHPLHPSTALPKNDTLEASSDDEATDKLEELAGSQAGIKIAGKRDNIDSTLSNYDLAPDSERTGVPRGIKIKHGSVDLQDETTTAPEAVDGACNKDSVSTTHGGGYFIVHYRADCHHGSESARRIGVWENQPTTKHPSDIRHELRKLDYFQDEMDHVISKHPSPSRPCTVSQYITSQIPTSRATSVFETYLQDYMIIGSNTTCVGAEEKDIVGQMTEETTEEHDEKACDELVLMVSLFSLFGLVLFAGSLTAELWHHHSI
ncbi:uncharacterized protein K460DRAFT_350205 [Cucurbitaria berberidis CBS 394.84]|uniref:Uncharacterized protein n=1 Tax=Cucurbitaria berberidis CBS 394.84 TaxID=1168544 RepID=A0A9P4LCL0_9PLEO|nr:uncharacterized protein K460DRAFT_350205 [Cucurbitaria berberidis CBS 394.84]KAF1850100.1 hypothetical protein K460DRAFT_350205 [Cucurbitaria berberidis CBS 394.84]